MKIVSWNVNGLRSLIRCDCLNQIFELEPDIICFQETKLSDLSVYNDVLPKLYRVYNNLSSKKGQSGVCIITKKDMEILDSRIGNCRFDTEGRLLSLGFDNDYSIVNLYFPHGKRDRSDIPYKLEAAKGLLDFLKRNNKEKTIVCTDFNIAHRTDDVARAAQNTNNTMFSKSEREIVDKLLEIGYVDSFRTFYKDTVAYTWWPYGFQARELNIGWRLDYIFTTTDMIKQVKEIKIRKDIMGSDHCPVVMEIDI